MPEKLYYIQKDGTELGPLSFAQMRSLWGRAEITVRTSFRYEKESIWRPVALLQSELDQPQATAPAQSAQKKGAKKAGDNDKKGCGCLILGVAFLIYIGNTTKPKDTSISVPTSSQQNTVASSQQSDSPKKRPPALSIPEKSEQARTLPSSNGGSTGNRDRLGKTIEGQNWYGASSKELFEKLVQYSVQGDSAAYKKLMLAGLQTGDTTFFKDHEKVLIMDTALFSGLVKVRRTGDVAEFWTSLEAVK
ncbi:MAG: DUF4339 domain-containing protein [Prosthecobacter sp.]|uniref:DUF4339 domain-containing protein n=1 Tax=Prosthecobacter sp. TaxID=1965333 RepID=UPI003BB1A9BD